MKLATKQVLTLEAAMELLEAAKAEATRIGAPGVIAVCDEGGWLLAFQRMDDAPMISSVDLAIGKAKSAALFRKPTGALEERINGGRTAQVTAPGYVQMQGGMPILIDGQVIGGLGISADTPGHDQEIAVAALAKVGAGT